MRSDWPSDFPAFFQNTITLYIWVIVSIFFSLQGIVSLSVIRWSGALVLFCLHEALLVLVYLSDETGSVPCLWATFLHLGSDNDEHSHTAFAELPAEPHSDKRDVWKPLALQERSQTFTGQRLCSDAGSDAEFPRASG